MEKLLLISKKSKSLYAQAFMSWKSLSTIEIVSMQPRAITITKQDQFTHFMNQNKHICLWYQCLAHVSNDWIIKIFILTNSINLDKKNKKYNLEKVLIELDKSNIFNISNFKK